MPYFDPIGVQFTHQHARPAALDDVSVAELGAAQRVLLTTDGTVTTLLETLAMEPVHAESCEVTPPDCGDPRDWLEAAESDTLSERRVFLVGQSSRQRYVMARSAIVETRATDHFFQALSGARGGLGEALRTTGMLTTRELLWYGAIKPARYPDWLIGIEPVGDFPLLSRAYRIRHGHLPLLFIHEIFLPNTCNLLR